MFRGEGSKTVSQNTVEPRFTTTAKMH